MPIKRWNRQYPDQTLVNKLASQLSLSPIAANVLVSRGYDTKDKIQAFLFDERLTNPMCLKDMDKAVNRIRQAAQNAEKVAVYGDYDCDGIMATVLMYHYLESIGVDVCYYIPGRDREGYGLNNQALKLIADDGVSLVVTVDNGITAIGEVEYASSLGLDIVITDHHKPRDVIPNAAAVVDPHRLDDESGCEYLAGVGVAFKLVCALENDDGGFMLDQYSDLVAVATIADIVPLVGENRLIVQRGLKSLQETNNEGLSALIEVCGLTGKELTSEHVAYGIVPRINSAGRFDHVDEAMELFIGEGDELQQLAENINSLNEKRRQIEDEIIAQIMKQLEDNADVLMKRVIVIYGENWHHGIVGIVASRMVERFGKPCIVISLEGDTIRGSARSVEGFSIIDAIHACAQHLDRYGGHNQAAGLTIKPGHLELFARDINAWAAEQFPVMPQQTLRIDGTIWPKLLNVESVQPLSKLEPYGFGNELPVFLVENCTVQGVYPIGNGKHVRIRFAGDNTVFYTVCFGISAQDFPYSIGEKVNLAVTVDVREWNDELRLSVKIKDIHLTNIDYNKIYESEQVYQRLMRREQLGAPIRQQAVPNRNDIAVVYRYLRSRGTMNAPDEVIFAKLSQNISCLCKLKIAIDVLDEMKLITRKPTGSGKHVSVVSNPVKVDMNDSKILQTLKQ